MSVSLLPGYQVYEYKLVLFPHEDLSKRISFIQEEFAKKFKIEQYQFGKPQLLLARFKQIKAFEQRIVDRLRIIAMGCHPVKIEIKDFGSYPSHTIYFNVTSKLPVLNLVKKVREPQRLMKLDADNKPQFLTDVHFIVAGKLKPWQYEEGWLEISNSHFTGKFIATSMVLMRRKEGEFKYAPVARFDFENLPIETKQGQLF